MAYKYTVKDPDAERTAKAMVMAAPISTKQAVEVCHSLRGKRLPRAMAILEDVISLKKAIPFYRYIHNVGHRAGIGTGRFPVKASEHILALLKDVNSNAQEKGFSTADLVVSHISAKKASRPWHPGRHVRRKMKRTHVEVIVEQRAAEGKAKSAASQKKAAAPAHPAGHQAAQAQPAAQPAQAGQQKKRAPRPAKSAAKSASTQPQEKANKHD